MILFLLILLLIVALIEENFRPRIERARGGLILWYGKTKRKYIKL